MTDDPRYRASERALLTELGDGTGVLLDLDSKFYFTLNETAICLWRALSEEAGSSRSELARRLCDEFEVDPSEADDATGTVLDLLVRERLVRRLAPSARDRGP